MEKSVHQTLVMTKDLKCSDFFGQYSKTKNIEVTIQLRHQANNFHSGAETSGIVHIFFSQNEND